MASDYRIFPARDTALATLTKFDPQCRSEGLKVLRRDYVGSFATSGGVYDQGLYVELVWQLLSLTKFTAVLSACGLTAANKARDVTIYCRDDLYVYHRYNGVAIRPQPSWQNSFVRNLVILVRDLEFIS